MKKTLSVVLACFIALSLITCGGGSEPTKAPTTAAAGDTTTAAAADTTTTGAAAAPEAGAEVTDKDKPLVWFNRQPSNNATGQLNVTTLNFNKDTYYVGFDADQGAELQGTMVKDHVEKNIDSIDHNDDGIIGYVLAIDDIGHDGSIACTGDVRKALGTTVEKDGNINNDPIDANADGTVTVVQDDSVEVDGKAYVVRELASQEIENFAGATWGATTAGNTVGTWSPSFGDWIGAAVSNNDGMGMSMFNVWSKDNKVPTFGYDADSGAVTAIAEGYGGIISQHADVQVYLMLRVLCDALDGVDIDIGIGTVSDVGSALSSDVYVYKADKRSYYVLSVTVTAENYTDFTDSIMAYAPVSNQPDEASHATKSVWLNIYNSADNFLESAYQSLLQKYNKPLNLGVDYIGGDGQTESNITNHPGNPSQHDALAINMVKTDNAASYTPLFEQQYSLE